MAVRQRKIESVTANENLIPGGLLAKKTLTTSTALNGKGISRRPALGEINLNTRDLKKTTSITQKPTALKNVSKVVSQKTTKCVTSNVSIGTRKVVTQKNNELKAPQKCEEKSLKTIIEEKEKKLEAVKEKQEEKTKSELCDKEIEVLGYSTKNLDIIEDNDDPQLVSEYIIDIYKYLRYLEAQSKVKEGFLQDKKSTPRMRSILISWIIEVHMNFKLLPETLYLCAAIIDRYLQKNVCVGRNNLQLVGITALHVAAKYEEVYIPDISDFVYVCDNAFTRNEIHSMELSILKELDFGLGRPLPLHFLRRYSKVGQVELLHHALAKYFLELNLIEYDISHIPPSQQAAAAICLSLMILNASNCSKPENVWTPLLQHHSCYTYEQLHPIIVKIATIIVKIDKQINDQHYKLIKKKYASSCNSKVSLCPELQNPIIKKLAVTP